MSSVLPTTRDHASRSSEIEREIHTILETRTRHASAYGPHLTRLWRLASESIEGGKLVRPRLLIDAFDALTERPAPGSAPRASALRIAAAVELLHFSFLLHDDVIDEDLLRRGAPNLIGKMLQDRSSARTVDPDRAGEGDAVHWARSNGILLGDLMLAATHQVFARETLPPAMRSRLLDLLDHTVTESVAGEQLDVGLSDGVLRSEVSAVLEMSRMKTATYTFDLPLRAAAILTEAEAVVEDAIGRISRHLGIAFQLQDDLLSVFGCSDEHGKDPFSDLREGKETVIIAFARTTTAWPSIAPRFGATDLSDADGLVIRALLTHCGAEDFVRSLIDDHLSATIDLVSSTGSAVPPALADVVLKLIDSLEGRRS